MNDWRTYYRVARPFRLGSRFAKGEVLRASDPDVVRILATRRPALDDREHRQRPAAPAGSGRCEESRRPAAES